MEENSQELKAAWDWLEQKTRNERWPYSDFYLSRHSDVLVEYAAHVTAEKDKEIERMRGLLANIVDATHSHVNGRDLLAELHPRNTLDIKRRKDGQETWHEGDWLTGLWERVKEAKVALNGEKADG